MTTIISLHMMSHDLTSSSTIISLDCGCSVCGCGVDDFERVVNVGPLGR